MQKKMIIDVKTNVIRFGVEVNRLGIVAKAKAQRRAKIFLGEWEADYSKLVQKTGLNKNDEDTYPNRRY